MRLAKSMWLTVTLCGMLLCAPAAAQAQQRMVGMYVHQHWPYNRPYCARTWTLDDWRGYSDGLKKLGYNTILIWPMLEIMPEPLTSTDRDTLRKISSVIDMLHKERGMKAYIVLCPNMRAENAEARKTTFYKRHYYYVEDLIDPADDTAVDRLIAWRRTLLEPLKNVDGVAIIDSDPGGYPGSTNQQFVDLLARHRRMFDTLRPGIELIYWMHAGWRGWSRLFEKAAFELGTPEEHDDTVQRLIRLNPEPWGMANGLEIAARYGIQNRVISFNYGRIELEPSFPMTNWSGENAYAGGALPGPRGVMGNAQTHCAQLPNTFAFARGALGKPIQPGDYQRFADDLIRGWGETIVRAWQALGSDDSVAMRRSLREIAERDRSHLVTGPLKGLLFGSAERFLSDLEKMLQMKMTGEELARAHERGLPLAKPFAAYVQAYTDWQKTHGFMGAMNIGRPALALRMLKHPAIEEVFAKARYDLEPRPGREKTNFERIRHGFAHMETFSGRLGDAMRRALAEMQAH